MTQNFSISKSVHSPRLLHEGVQLGGGELAAEVLHLLVGDVAAVVLVQGLERQLGSRGHLSLEKVKC